MLREAGSIAAGIIARVEGSATNCSCDQPPLVRSYTDGSARAELASVLQTASLRFDNLCLPLKFPGLEGFEGFRAEIVLL